MESCCLLLTLGKLTCYICKSYQTIKLNTGINIVTKIFYERNDTLINMLIIGHFLLTINITEKYKCREKYEN